MVSIGDGMVRGTYRITMAEFAKDLRLLLALSTGDSPNTRILDKTGLEGRFEYKLEFAQTRPSEANDPAGGPTLFSALEKQLGLRLEQGKKNNFDLLVIDHIDKVPTEN
jgi:uncharacterized protein (TIGR03435 family)